MGLIYLDTCLLVYAIENDPVYGAATREKLAGVAAGQLAISHWSNWNAWSVPSAPATCNLQPATCNYNSTYEEALSNLAQLPMPEPVFLRSAQLRARFGLKTPEALHLATAQHHGCDALWTNDNRLAQAGHGLAVGLLED